jgi:hypothetical protein
MRQNEPELVPGKIKQLHRTVANFNDMASQGPRCSGARPSKMVRIGISRFTYKIYANEDLAGIEEMKQADSLSTTTVVRHWVGIFSGGVSSCVGSTRGVSLARPPSITC